MTDLFFAKATYREKKRAVMLAVHDGNLTYLKEILSQEMEILPDEAALTAYAHRLCFEMHLPELYREISREWCMKNGFENYLNIPERM